MTIALRKPALAARLCSWYQKDHLEHNRIEFSKRCKDFLGNGRKVPHDMRAALDKVEVCIRLGPPLCIYVRLCAPNLTIVLA
jgi:hypothetical protein